jgi:hypothetical protein
VLLTQERTHREELAGRSSPTSTWPTILTLSELSQFAIALDRATSTVSS